MEAAFEGAGANPGLEIWRIESFNPVPYPKSDYGKFYVGDSYIVLFTKEENGRKSWDLHFWLGSETSQDEAGAAAILAVHLDDQLDGTPIQYREVQEHESQIFLSHFKCGVRYVPGGVASGFVHVDSDDYQPKLYQIKGKRNVRVKQVEFSVSSMNRGDCFILDAEESVYIYVGEKAKRCERIKAITVANQIRDQDHGGRSKVYILDEFASSQEINAFFDALGDGTADDVANAIDDDEHFEKSIESSVRLYNVSNSSGDLRSEEVDATPFVQDLLDTNDCYILDTGNSNLYVWVGKSSNNLEKSAAMKIAEAFLTEKNYPAWTQVQRIVENGEPPSFQQYFRGWKVKELEEHFEEPKEVKLERKSAGEAQEFMPDDGSGEVEIYRIENFELVPVDKDYYGKFFGGDSYIVKYNYNGKFILYIWQGNDSSQDEKAASAIQAVNMDNELGGKAIQIRVVQDYEPKHFLHIFQGKLIIFLGGKASGFRNMEDYDTYVEGATRIFRIRGTQSFNVKASQQLPIAKSLQSDDVFLVENNDTLWIWKGKNADEVEVELATNFANQLSKKEATFIEEGNEPPEFWDALDGSDSYETDKKCLEVRKSEPRLFHCVVKKSSFKFEEMQSFSQTDLVQDDLALLDTGNVIYVWIGKDSDEEERRMSISVGQKFLRKFKRQEVPIIIIRQGEEPTAFTDIFPSWNSEMFENTETYEELRAKFMD